MNNQRKTIPHDTAYNKIYPFPKFMPKWMAAVLLMIIASYLVFSLISLVLGL